MIVAYLILGILTLWFLTGSVIICLSIKPGFEAKHLNIRCPQHDHYSTNDVVI